MSPIKAADEPTATHAFTYSIKTKILQWDHCIFLRHWQSNPDVAKVPPSPSKEPSASPSESAPSMTNSPLLSLPPEILLDVIPRLPYPDALALKHTHPLFYNTVDTSVRLKVAWLLDRKVRGLPTPLRKCCLKSDGEFCNGGLVGGWERGKRRGKVEDGRDQVRKIMARRRRHGECEGGRCEVLVGRRCAGWREVDGSRMGLYRLRRCRSWYGRQDWMWWASLDSLVGEYGLWFSVGLMGILFASVLKAFW